MIRRAAPADHDFIIQTGARVYAPLGDYGRILPGWLAHPGVLGFVEADDRATDRVTHQARGFILLGFYTGWGEGSPRPGELVADLLAIAVAPEHQRAGIGSQLLAFALDFVSEAPARAPVKEIRLTVAESNPGAQRLFSRHGFDSVDEHHGEYDGGQRAIRMRRVITPASPSPASA
jgi:ribosomal protein S18 acetylase RimI-like enzyme